MGCELNPDIVYTEFSQIIRRQKEVRMQSTFAIRKRIRISGIVYGLLCVLAQILKKLIEERRKEMTKRQSGLTCFKDGVRQIPIESIPGVIGGGLKIEQG